MTKSEAVIVATRIANQYKLTGSEKMKAAALRSYNRLVAKLGYDPLV